MFAFHSKYEQCVGAILFIAIVALVAAIGSVDEKFAFQACFGTLLSLLGCIQLYIATVLFLNRQNSLVELSQPIGLSMFVILGSVATAGSFLFAIPESDVGCALRQPIILISISSMGSILVSRSWRISCIVGHTLSFASATNSNEHNHDLTESNQTNAEKVQAAKSKVMKALTKVSACSSVVGSCGRYKVKPSQGIRQKITLADSIRVAFVLLIPQTTLQVINLSVPAFRSHSTEIHHAVYTCQYVAGGSWFLGIGITLAVTPFFVALLLNVKSEGLPGIFQEFNKIASSMRVSAGVMFITLPTISLISNLPGRANAHAFLMAATVLSFVLPLVYNITIFWMQACNTKRSEIKRKRLVSNLQSQTSSVDTSSSSKQVDRLETVKKAEDGIIMAKMFATMGRAEKALEVEGTVLSMFKADGDYSHDGGFNNAEIDSLGPKSLEIVIKTLVSNSKGWLNCMFSCNGEERDCCLNKSAKGCSNALSIFDKAPAKQNMKDRSVMFPGYSHMYQSFVSGAFCFPDNQSPADFENGIAFKFVQETQFQMFHHCRSLAMKAGVLARHRNFNAALAVVEDIKSIYDPALHSMAISQEYASDHCAAVFALSTNWLYHLNRTEEALRRCDEIIEWILPELDKQNMLGLTMFLLPIIRIFIAQERADRAYQLYNDCVVEALGGMDAKNSPALCFMKPILILLKCYTTAIDSDNNQEKYDGLEDDIQWILNGEEKVTEFIDTAFMNHLYWSVYCLLAEVCLHLAKRAHDHKQKRAIIKEGLRLSRLGNEKMKDESGNAVLPVAYSFQSQIDSDLKDLSLPV